MPLVFAQGLHVYVFTCRGWFLVLKIQNVLWHGNEICLVYSFTQLILFFLYVYWWGFGLVCLCVYGN